MPEAAGRRKTKGAAADGETPVVFDTVILSNFAQAGILDWLCGRYGRRGLVTTAVLDELAAGAACGFEALRDADRRVEEAGFGIISLNHDEREVFAALRQFLGAGEAASIAAAAARAATVATDDRAARHACGQRGLAYTGTIGILIAGVQDGGLERERAEAAHARMVEAGFYSPVRRLADLR